MDTDLCDNVRIRMFSWHKILIGLVGLLIFQAGLLYWFGQPMICECGEIKIWEGDVSSSGNSQHVADWYTPSHIIHGLLFFMILTWLFPRLSLGQRLLLAAAVEVGWELLENTPMVIEHYREQALAQGYVGDSILNSLSDTLAMIGGFWLAHKLHRPTFIWMIIILLELLALYFIRDSLLLNITGFIYQPEWLASWQMAGRP